MRNRSIKALLGGCLTLLVGIALVGCAPSSEDKLAQMDREAKGEAVQTYTSKELEELTGEGYFKDYFTFDELLDKYGLQRGSYTEGKFTRGGYVVAQDAPLKPGLYYLQGSQQTLCTFDLYNPYTDTEKAATGSYFIGRNALQYIGSYFVTLEEGEVILFEPKDESFCMWAAPVEALGVSAPYQSGCYRVGIDIPAGTYTVRVDETALDTMRKSVEGEPGAYVMSNVSFPKDSSNIIGKYPIGDSESISIQVNAGEFLELYTAVATPV